MERTKQDIQRAFLRMMDRLADPDGKFDMEAHGIIAVFSQVLGVEGVVEKWQKIPGINDPQEVAWALTIIGKYLPHGTLGEIRADEGQLFVEGVPPERMNEYHREVLVKLGWSWDTRKYWTKWV